MKTRKLFLYAGVATLFFSLHALAQATNSPAPAQPQSPLSFILANKAALSLLVYAILDVLVLFNPKLSGNGFVHQLMISVGAVAAPAEPTSANTNTNG